MKNVRFIVEGGRKLKGQIKASGSKNAALPILCASLILDGKSKIQNVPNIRDVRTLLKIFEYLDVETYFDKNKNEIEIDTKNIKNKKLPQDLVGEFRAAILLLSPLLVRFGKVESAYPGGCVLGKRSVFAHLEVFRRLGAKVQNDENFIKIEGNIKSSKIVLPEISVTATENAIVAAASVEGETELRLAAAEPHVQDLCYSLIKSGVKIEGLGGHCLKIKGNKNLKSIEHKVTSDYLEVGTLMLAGLLTKSEIEILDAHEPHLDSFLQKLREIGADFEIKENSIKTLGFEKLLATEKLRTAVYPSFPTDLQAPFTILLTQAEGKSRIFETLFEGRFSYLYELEKMGAIFEIINSHEAIVFGPNKLKGATISSCDIRAGAAMILAALIAEGETEINNVYYIDRGYEDLEIKLNSLGANIKRV